MANYQGWESLCVFRPSLGSFHVTVAQSFLSCGQGVTPGRMWLASTRQDRYKVLDRPAKNALYRGELRIRIGCVSILEDGTLQKVSVKAAIWGSVVSDDPSDGLYTNLCSAIRVWCTPHSFKNWRVVAAVNSGPPSVAHSSGMPKVANVRRKQSISPLDPSRARSTMGLLE